MSPPSNETPAPMTHDLILQEIHALQQQHSTMAKMVQDQQLEIQKLKQSLQAHKDVTVTNIEFSTRNNDIDLLKSKVKEIQEKLYDLIFPQSTPPRRSMMFPNVNPSTIAPTLTRSSSHNVSTTHQHPPIPPPAPESILPFGTRVTIQHAGQSQDCLIQKCLRTQQSMEYQASLSGGEQVQF